MRYVTVGRIVLTVSGPWSVGDPDGAGDLHTTVLRDRHRRPEVPATSLAGSLRDHLKRRLGEDGVVEVMGSDRSTSDGVFTPSKLRILGVLTDAGEGPAEAEPVVSRRTAIDHQTGAARQHQLRSEEHHVRDTTLRLYFSYDGVLPDGVRDGLRCWRPIVGRHRTNGWGRTTITDIAHSTVDLRCERQLVRWCTGRGPQLINDILSDADATHDHPEAPGEETYVVRVGFAAAAGIHVGTGESQPDDDGSYSPTLRRGETPLVPASSWRGVVRGHCAFILRSIGCAEDETDAAITNLFGGEQHRGRLVFHDARVTGTTHRTDHVAIDRLTGGARSGLLFTEEAARGTVELRISADGPLAEWESALLGHVVQDIADGYLAIGGRTTRGLGTLTLAGERNAPDPSPIDIEAVRASLAKATRAGGDTRTEAASA